MVSKSGDRKRSMCSSSYCFLVFKHVAINLNSRSPPHIPTEMGKRFAICARTHAHLPTETRRHVVSIAQKQRALVWFSFIFARFEFCCSLWALRF